MKKSVFLMIFIVLITILTSCSKGDSTILFDDKDNYYADARMEELFDAIKQQNENSIKKLFSKKAIAESEEIDKTIKNLLSFIQGELLSWNRDESPIVFDSVTYGNNTKQLVTWYTLKTDKEEYLIFLVDYPTDTINPENSGLYSLRILRLDDENKLEGTWEDWVIPGIYIID